MRFINLLSIYMCIFNCYWLKNCACNELNAEHQVFVNIVKLWADNIGRELTIMAEEATRRNKVVDSFKQTKVVFQNGSKLVDDIADKLKVMMAQKEEIVKEIAEKAEMLSFRRKEPIFENSTFDYYDTYNITNTSTDSILEENLLKDRLKRDKQFECENVYDGADTTNSNCPQHAYIEHEEGYFRNLPLLHHPHFATPVNLNYSVLKIAVSIYNRDEDILNDVRSSEAMDLTFKKNYKMDPTLTWQYFAGTSGFLRHYPDCEREVNVSAGNLYDKQKKVLIEFLQDAENFRKGLVPSTFTFKDAQQKWTRPE